MKKCLAALGVLLWALSAVPAAEAGWKGLISLSPKTDAYFHGEKDGELGFYTPPLKRACFYPTGKQLQRARRVDKKGLHKLVMYRLTLREGKLVKWKRLNLRAPALPAAWPCDPPPTRDPDPPRPGAAPSATIMPLEGPTGCPACSNCDAHIRLNGALCLSARLALEAADAARLATAASHKGKKTDDHGIGAAYSRAFDTDHLCDDSTSGTETE